MFELLQIFLSIFIYFIIFSYPINYFNYNKIFIKIKLNFFDLILLNGIIHLNIYLFLSFFKFNIFFIFLFDIFLAILFFLFYFKQYNFFLKKNSKLFFFFVVLCFSLFVSIAYNPLQSWDGIAHWFFKALNYYQEKEYSDLINVPMNYYPHLGGYLWSYFWKGSLLQAEYFGRFLYPFLFLISIFSLFEQLSKNFSIVEKIILIFIVSYFCIDLMLFGGYQEYLIFILFYIFSRTFLIMKDSKDNLDRNLLSIFFLFTSFLILWSKQEGLFYYIILYIIYLIHSDHKFDFKFLYTILFLILLLFFTFIKIYYFKGIQFNESILHEELSNNFNIKILLYKILIISKYLLISFIKYPIWIIIFFSTLFVFLKTNYFYKKNFFFTYLFLIFLLFFAIYLQTKEDISQLLPLTLSRLVFHSAGFLLPIIIECLNNIKKKNHSIFN